MRKLIVFNQLSLDGYFSDASGDMSWAHKHDPEWNQFVAGNAQSGGMLLFGRKTYELMAGFWPTPAARASLPEVAERMNQMPKVVFSRTMEAAAWSQTELVKEDLLGAVRRLKSQPGPDITILGSGSIVSQLTAAGLIDEFQLVINPLVLGQGRTLFEGLDARRPMRLLQARTFANGNVVLSYEPAR